MAGRLTRRDVLRGGLWLGGVAASGPFARWLNQNPDGAFAFAYYSDTHVGLRDRVDVNIELVREMKSEFSPLFAINGGDVTDYGWKGEYENYKRVLAASDVPVFHVPGNHDVRWSGLGLTIYEDYVGVPFSSFDSHGCRFFLLDSTVPLSHWGHFEKPMLDWLAAELDKTDRETPVFLCTHHWVGRNDDRVDNEDALMSLIEPYNVKLILNGHGHSDLYWLWDGIPNTMNKGLYQGSYERVTVDRERGTVLLDRRTTDSPLKRVAEISLAPSREKRRTWQAIAGGAILGTPVPVGPVTAKEYSWNKGEWQPFERGVPTKGLYAGYNTLALREPGLEASQRFPVEVIDPESRLQPAWSRELTGGVMGHVVLDRGALYLGGMDGSVYRLDPKDGATVWRAQTGGYNHSSPAVLGETVVIGSADRFVYGFDRATGEQKWTHETHGPVYGTADFAKGVAAIASGDGRVYGLDPATGGQAWLTQLPVSDVGFAQSRATTDGERFFVAGWDNTLYALDAATGEIVWKAGCCADMSFHYSPAIGWPAVAHGCVYVVANGNRMYCFDCASGEERWVYSSPGDKVGYSSPVVVGRQIVVGCLGDRGEARCVHAITGQEMWAATVGEVVYEGSAAVSDGCALIPSVSGLLSLIDVLSGEILARWRMPKGLGLSTPAAEGGRFYAASYSGWAFAFDLRP